MELKHTMEECDGNEMPRKLKYWTLVSLHIITLAGFCSYCSYTDSYHFKDLNIVTVSCFPYISPPAYSLFTNINIVIQSPHNNCC